MKTPLWSLFAIVAAGLAFFAFAPAPSKAETATMVPAPETDETLIGADATETAVFAGGCFWGVQGVFQHVEGVRNAVSGYAGGAKETAAYEKVGSGRTGHAEAVKVTYDPRKITYGRLLQIYFSVAHDPTELNRQGPDTGPQYRSTIFTINAEQTAVARAYIEQLDKANTFGKPLATTVEPGKPFFAAEGYHQDYLTLHPTQPYIVYNDLPKIAALKKMFPAVYREKPALVSEAGL
ncbi:MAG: peptide-methionine (S)-S-oxide reductase MsrA [Proteobacteria bacterium]|nr:peptide-methionine (S)-S-oxide reductase MsrA [Pseudomonadota bacterium]